MNIFPVKSKLPLQISNILLINKNYYIIYKMEHKINLMELSIDQIMRKIKSFKADPNLNGLTLIVKRKQQGKMSKSKHYLPNHIQNLLDQRRLNKNKTFNDINVSFHLNESNDLQKQNENTIYNQNSQSLFKHKQQLAQNDQQNQNQNYDFINDSRMIKAKKNYAQGNYDTAINTLTSILSEVQDSNVKRVGQIQGDKQRKIAILTFHLGNCYYRKKNFDKAIEYYSYQIAEENFKHKAMRKSNLGAIYLHLKKNQQSLRNYTQSLKIYSQCQCDDVDLSNTYHNVGNIYLREKMYDIASKYFQMSIQQRKNKSPDAELSLFYSAFKLGISQKFEQKYEESIKSLFYALSFSQRGVGEVVQVFKQIAMLYQLINKPNQALNYYEKICDNPKATPQDKGYAYQRAALVYMRQKQQNEGQRIMKIAYQCYESAGNERKVSFLRKTYKLNSAIG